MTEQKTKTNSGFIALISAIIVSVILLLMVTNLSLNGFYARSDILDSELKEKSSALAEACVDTALLNMANNSAYSPTDEVVAIGEDDCKIQSIYSLPSQKIINIKADYNHAVTNLKITVNSSDLSIVSWEET